MKNKIKISSIIFLIAAIGLISYLSISLESKDGYKIDLIELNGNFHLTKDQYFRFANLEDQATYKNLTLQIIKDRIEKHPYVENADVKYDGNNKVSIIIKEKNFTGILLKDDTQYILTDNMEVLPMLLYTKKLDYPVVNNAEVKEDLSETFFLKENEDIITSFKIITTIKLINPELYDNLSEVNLRDGGDIILYFSLIPYPVILGRGNEVRKVVYFNRLWMYLKGKDLNSYMNYVDLRFDKHIYMGISEESTSQGDNRS